MDLATTLAFGIKWFNILFLVGLVGVIIFYVLYRREQS